MGFTRRTSSALAAWVACMMCGSNQAIAVGDPPAPAAPVQPVKTDTVVTAPAATQDSTTPVTEAAPPVTTPASTAAGTQGTTRLPAVVVKSTQEDSVLTNDEVKRMLQAGYKQEKTSNGDILYCRKEDHTGSMVAKKRCVTGPQLKAMAEDKRQFTELVQEKGGMNPRPTAQDGSRP